MAACCCTPQCHAEGYGSLLRWSSHTELTGSAACGLSQPLSAAQPCGGPTARRVSALRQAAAAATVCSRCDRSLAVCHSGTTVRCASTPVPHTLSSLHGAPSSGAQARLDQLFDELCSSEAKYAEFLLVGVMQAAAAPPSAASHAGCMPLRRCGTALSAMADGRSFSSHWSQHCAVPPPHRHRRSQWANRIVAVDSVNSFECFAAVILRADEM